MQTRARVRRARRGFTLLEVLMVIVIIGILAAFVVPALMGTQGRAQVDQTTNMIRSGFTTPLETFRMHTGRFPTTDEGLIVLLKKPDDEEIAEKWSGPYIKDEKMLKDAWGRDLIYVSPGNVNETGYDLSSAGPNGNEGDDDDIVSWPRT